MRIKGINRVTAKGKVYHYHRKTGKRIHAPVGTAAFLAEVEVLNAWRRSRSMIDLEL